MWQLIPYMIWIATSFQFYAGTFLCIIDWAMKESYNQSPNLFMDFGDGIYRTS